MKFNNTLVATVAITLLSTGCVKPTEDNQVVYDNSQPINTQPAYEEAPIVYDNTISTNTSGVVYSDIPADQTVVSTPSYGTYTQEAQPAYTYTQEAQPAQPVYTYAQEAQPAQPAYTYTQEAQPAQPAQPIYTNPYETTSSTVYSDPYAAGGSNGYTPAPTPAYSTTTTTSGGGGIHLQIAALKDAYAAEEFKNTLSLAPGQSAYVQKGAMNKVIVTGISSRQEANRLKESRFPGAFIVSNTSGSSYQQSYTPPVSPNTYSTGGYTVDTGYGSSSSSATSYNGGGVGVQIGAYSTRSKAQSVADANRGQYSPVVKKVGRLYKVILTGFSSRSVARSHANQVGGFVVSAY